MKKKFTISSCLPWMKRLDYDFGERYKKGMAGSDGWQDTYRDEIRKSIGGIR